MSNKSLHQLIASSNKAMAAAQYEKALPLLKELVKRQPNNFQWLQLKSEVLLRLGNYAEALVDLAVIVEAQPENQSALLNFGVALNKNNKNEDARLVLESMLELNPSNLVGVYINLGEVYQKLSMPKEQLRVAAKAIEIDPSNPIAYNNLAASFLDIGKVAEAREALLTAKALEPNNFEANCNLISLDYQNGDFEKMITSFETLLSEGNLTREQENVLRFLCSPAYLQVGKLEDGWSNYEFGFGLTISSHGGRSLGKFPEPKWRGEDLTGKSLLVRREQGVGDELLFSNCFIDLEEIDAKVTIECDPRLVDIFQRTYPKITFIPDQKRSLTDDFLSKFSYISFMGSLPGQFRKKLDDFNRPFKTLKPLPSLVTEFKQRLSPFKSKKLIGIAWRTGLLLANRTGDATALTDWEPLLCKPNLQFVNLMWGDGEAEIQKAENKFGIKILRWNDLDLKNDFESILALMQNLDAVVSVSSTPYALSSFSGIKTFLLTPNLWQLLGQKETHPWNKFITPIVIENNKHLLSKLNMLEAMLEAL
jgi:tetratricopeptide (TPR) repeat protein